MCSPGWCWSGSGPFLRKPARLALSGKRREQTAGLPAAPISLAISSAAWLAAPCLANCSTISDGSPALQALARPWLSQRLLSQGSASLATKSLSKPLVILSSRRMIGKDRIDRGGPSVIGKAQLVSNVPAEGELGHTRDGEGPDDEIADKNADLRLRRKGPSKAHSAALLSCDIAPQQRLISAKCLTILPPRNGEFTGQNIGGDHRERRALPCQQRHAEGGITD